MTTPSPPRRFKRCIIHIGTEKTGTSAIQHYLSQHREELLNEGVLYPETTGETNLSQWEFVAIVHRAPWEQDIGRTLGIKDEQGQAHFRQKFQADLQAEFDRKPNADTLLISSEHLQSRVSTPKMITALKKFLEPWVERFEILVYFRRQDQVAISLESTRLKSSVKLASINPAGTIKTMPYYYAYDQMYKKWADAFGKDAISARLYEQKKWLNQDIVHDFCSACRISLPETKSVVLNQSLNRKGFHFLHALNQRFPVTPGDKKDPIRAALVRAVATQYAGKYYPLNRDQAKEIYREFEETNERLRELAFPDYPAPLFEEDFSDYPEAPESIEPEYGDAVEIAMHLWRQEMKPLPRPRFRDIFTSLFRK